MNILDDNSENVLLEKISFGKILMYGIGIPIGLTFLIFYYLFDGEFSLNPLILSFGKYAIGVSEFSILFSILFILIVFLLSSTWVRNINSSRTLKVSLQILVLFFLIITISFAILGELKKREGWTIYPPLSALPPPNIVLKNDLLIPFHRVMFFISLTGIFSIWDFYKK